MKYGKIYRTSRYLMLIADRNKPNPDAESAVMSMLIGSIHTIAMDGRKRKYAHNIHKKSSVIKKSTNPVTTVDNGKITFGIYTFWIIFPFSMSVLLALVSVFEKKVQKIRPLKTNNGYGRELAVGIFAYVPKNTVKIIMDTNG